VRVLVACEFSGTVREAFRARGHDAWSCDLVPCEIGGPHIIGDALEVVGRGWDLMVAHPPCTHLASSGQHWFSRGLKSPHLRDEAIAFVAALMRAPIARICIENPIGVLSSAVGKPAQIVQPWQFGEDASKATCLWLSGLAPLVADPSGFVAPRLVDGRARWSNQTDGGQCRRGPGPDRARERSRFWPGIARAMAEQWG